MNDRIFFEGIQIDKFIAYLKWIEPGEHVDTGMIEQFFAIEMDLAEIPE